jgi:hypothetical protein
MCYLLAAERCCGKDVAPMIDSLQAGLENVSKKLDELRRYL